MKTGELAGDRGMRRPREVMLGGSAIIGMVGHLYSKSLAVHEMGGCGKTQ